MTDFYTCSCILKQYVVLVEVFKENSVSQKYVDRKENCFLDNWEHCFWHYPKIQHVVVSYNWSGVWKTSEVFILRTLTRWSFSTLWMDLLMRDFEHCALVMWKIWIHWVIKLFQKLHFFVPNQHISLKKINLLIISIASNHSLETIKFMVADISFLQY